MQSLAKFVGAALVGAFALLAAPAAQAQVGVNINIGAPGWGPQVPYGTQYYYIPEIDGYYDLYSQQYIVFQDGYWVPLPQLYGYDPYQFHPVVIGYRGREPWLQRDYYHQRYAYQPYRAYGPGRNGYYNGGYGRPGYGYGYDNRGYSNGRGYGDRDHDNRGYNDHDRDNRGGYGDHDNRGGYGGRDYRSPYNGGDHRGQNANGGYGGQPQAPQQQPQQQPSGGYGGQGQQGGGRGDNGSHDNGNHGGGRSRVRN